MPVTINGSTGVSINPTSVDTTHIIDNSVNSNKIANSSVTATKLSGGQSGTAPVYGARAWCVFDGTLSGTNAPIAGGNVTSVTRNAVGDYTINFTTVMPDSNYIISGTIQESPATVPTNYAAVTIRLAGTNFQTTSSFRLVICNARGAVAGDNSFDASRVHVIVFR